PKLVCFNICEQSPLLLPTSLFEARSDPPLLTSFLQHQLGIHISRQKPPGLERPPLLVPINPKRKVKTHIPKVPKQPLMLGSTPGFSLLNSELHGSGTGSVNSARGQRSPPTSQPLPPIGSSSAGWAKKETKVLKTSDGPAEDNSTEEEQDGGLNFNDADKEEVETIFMTQVRSVCYVIKKKQSSPATGGGRGQPKSKNEKQSKKRQKKKRESWKYKGYEELLNANPDAEFIDPTGIQQNVQALEYALNHMLIFHDPKREGGTHLQKLYRGREKKMQKSQPPSKSRVEAFEDILKKMKHAKTTVETPLASILQKQQPRNKEYAEAVGLLKEMQLKF
uniref:Uncharacterized protein n=1 Tax=Latimeria chalumnae TaxID=7897 RepID=H2ZSH1_LATCH